MGEKVGGEGRRTRKGFDYETLAVDKASYELTMIHLPNWHQD